MNDDTLFSDFPLTEQEILDLLSPKHWTVEKRLYTPRFAAQIRADGTMHLFGNALITGFSPEETITLTRFLLAEVILPPLPPVEEITVEPVRVDLEDEK